KYLAMSNYGQVTVMSDGTSVMTAGGATLPALPSGVSVTGLAARKLNDGTYAADVLGGDGRVYSSVRDLRGFWDLWRTFPSTGVALFAEANWGDLAVLSTASC
ncbi:hypothetical protein, partial [Microbacterium sp. 22296]|uniref:hypothetical protein n=1 Tax=Microbacterium sp. 22296 TaxID=3453903 RepID=UPI003F84DF4D